VVDLPAAVEDALDLASPAAARQVRIDTALWPAQVTGDRVLLERLISNLTDNAVRHSGWVLATTGREAGLCRGQRRAPIPADQVSGLFEPFRRPSGRAEASPAAAWRRSWHRWPVRTAAVPRHAAGPMAASKFRSGCPRTRDASGPALAGSQA
jgi:hypothetical protein